MTVTPLLRDYLLKQVLLEYDIPEADAKNLTLENVSVVDYSNHGMFTVIIDTLGIYSIRYRHHEFVSTSKLRSLQ